MKAEHGLDLPRRLQIEFSSTIQHITEDTGTEISPTEMWSAFEEQYLPADPAIRLLSHELSVSAEKTRITAQLLVDGEHLAVAGEGNGPIDAMVHALRRALGVDIDVVDYHEHAVSAGADATAVAYVESVGPDATRWGVGLDPNILTASLKAVVGAVLRQR
jgi:2-isopropylmalate synthase